MPVQVRALPKLEIDVCRPDQIREAADIAKRHSCPALVVSPDLVVVTGLTRSVKQAKFKVITTIDLPRGELYGKEKFHGLPGEAMGADGFEILLTPRNNASEILAEIKYLHNFIRQYFGPIVEIRFILGIGQSPRTEQHFKNMLLACRSIPMPTLVRTTVSTKLSPTQAGVEVFNKQIAMMKESCAVPIKISGNVDYNIYNNVHAERFAVSIQQAQLIAKEATGKPQPVASEPVIP